MLIACLGKTCVTSRPGERFGSDAVHVGVACDKTVLMTCEYLFFICWRHVLPLCPLLPTRVPHRCDCPNAAQSSCIPSAVGASSQPAARACTHVGTGDLQPNDLLRLSQQHSFSSRPTSLHFKTTQRSTLLRHSGPSSFSFFLVCSIPKGHALVPLQHYLINTRSLRLLCSQHGHHDAPPHTYYSFLAAASKPHSPITRIRWRGSPTRFPRTSRSSTPTTASRRPSSRSQCTARHRSSQTRRSTRGGSTVSSPSLYLN